MKKKAQKSQSWTSEGVQVIIETPRGSRNKYKYKEETGRMKFSKVLPEGMMFRWRTSSSGRTFEGSIQERGLSLGKP